MGFPVQPELIPRRTPRLNVPAELLRLGYVLLSRIGEGATAEVWDAKHGPTGRVVALKVSRGDVPEAAVISARMQTAWNVGRGLRHAHIVATLDGGLLPDGARLAGHGASGRAGPSRASSTRAGSSNRLARCTLRGKWRPACRCSIAVVSSTGT
jgi:hypothetical protein